MAWHIVYGRPYCNDAKEGVGGITPPKLNRGGWNSARTEYFEGNVVCKNLGAIGSGAAEGRRKSSLGDPKKLDFFSVDTTTHDLTHFPPADFHEIFARTRGSVWIKQRSLNLNYNRHSSKNIIDFAIYNHNGTRIYPRMNSLIPSEIYLLS